MNSIETVVRLILLFMGISDLCRKVGRPNLTMAARAAKSLLNAGIVEATTRTVLPDLFVTIAAPAFLPRTRLQAIATQLA